MDVIGLGISPGDCRGNTHSDSHGVYWGAPDRVWGTDMIEVPGRRRDESLLKIPGMASAGAAPFPPPDVAGVSRVVHPSPPCESWQGRAGQTWSALHLGSQPLMTPVQAAPST